MTTSRSSYSSATCLLSASNTPPHFGTSQKDYSSAFANLQSTYGTSGYFPAPPSKESKDKSSPRMPPSYSPDKTPPNTISNSQKNYESAFAALSSSYGFGGSVPALPRKAKSQKPPTTSNLRPPNTHSTSSAHSPKDYESAFGRLSSSFGFTGGAPTLPRKTH